MLKKISRQTFCSFLHALTPAPSSSSASLAQVPRWLPWEADCQKFVNRNNYSKHRSHKLTVFSGRSNYGMTLFVLDTCLKAQLCEQRQGLAQQRQILSFQDRKHLDGTVPSPSQQVNGCRKPGSKWVDTSSGGWYTCVAPGGDLPEELLCSVEQHWYGYPTGKKKLQDKELKDSPIEPPESGKQPNCCSMMCATSRPQQGSRLPGSCWPFHHRNFSTVECWCRWSLLDIFLLLLSFLSPQLPAQPIYIIWYLN